MAMAGCAFALATNPIPPRRPLRSSALSALRGKRSARFFRWNRRSCRRQPRPASHAVFSAYNLVGSLRRRARCARCRLAVFLLISGDRRLSLLDVGVRCMRRFVLAFLFALLSPQVEAQIKTAVDDTATSVYKNLAASSANSPGLFALDAFAGAFIVQSIVAYWFYLRYDTDLKALGGIFFGTNVLAALSFLAAPAIVAPFRSTQHDGFHSPAIEYSAASGAVDAKCRMGGCGLLIAPPAVANGRADASILHNGSGRSRRTRRRRRRAIGCRATPARLLRRCSPARFWRCRRWDCPFCWLGD